jgi:SAM-dependent methyltransferase
MFLPTHPPTERLSMHPLSCRSWRQHNPDKPPQAAGDTMSNPACPICGGTSFADFNTRRSVRCEVCGSLERGRYLWLVLHKRVNLAGGAAVAHFAPERFLMDHFAALPDVNYFAFDKHPEHYPHAVVRVGPLDLCTDMESLPSEAFDLVIHSHVLEHLPCAIEPVLVHMKRILKPGGIMLFQVPIDGDVSSEGIDPPVTDEEKELRQRQGDHMRVFGRRDFAARVAALLGSDCLVKQGDLFTPEELAAARVPIARKGEPTGKSVFLYRKP